jgi:predicted GNAT superfamily acetyltransferase
VSAAVEIRELDDVDDLRALAHLFAVVWGTSDAEPIDSDVLKALSLSGNYVSGAYANGLLIGGLVGWLGGDPGHDLHMHSHILGVLPGDEAHGLGFRLKQHQRRWCLERGVNVMEWTTDPLVRRNAYFNLSKLGARAPEYLVNVYGAMHDGINAGEESDRLLIRWHLDSSEAEAAAMGRPVQIESEGKAVLSAGANGQPVLSPSRAPLVICEVPDDIVSIRRSDPALARRWRLALREALHGSMLSGYRIKGATKSGWYVLETKSQ